MMMEKGSGLAMLELQTVASIGLET